MSTTTVGVRKKTASKRRKLSAKEKKALSAKRKAHWAERKATRFDRKNTEICTYCYANRVHILTRSENSNVRSDYHFMFENLPYVDPRVCICNNKTQCLDEFCKNFSGLDVYGRKLRRKD